MVDNIAQINKLINDFVWGPYMLVLLVGTGVFFTIRLKLFQVTKIRLWLKRTAGKVFQRKKAGEGAVTPFQALTTALAGTVGTGNMIGVSTAIVLGGPGAVFWMWVSAFFGMMTKYAEIVLSQKYRRRNDRGEWVGGPMYYIQDGLPKLFRPLAYLFAAFGALASFGIGNMTQVNSIADSIENLLGRFGLVEPVPNAFSIPKLIVGIVLALLAALVIMGGLKRIGQVTEMLVPFMCIVFVLGSLGILIMQRAQIIPAFSNIFSHAFDFQSAAGGVAGYTVAGAMRYGVARGVFSNEAGLGSAPIAHAAADADSPVEQGLWGVFEVFVDTIVICTMTALVVLTSGAYDGTAASITGSTLTIAAYHNTYGIFGTVFVTLCVTLFAFSTVLGWSLYGQRCFEFLFKGRGMRLFQLVFIAAIVVASVMRLDLAWDIADTLNGLMAIPNLIALLLLSNVVVRLTKEYLQKISWNKEQ